MTLQDAPTKHQDAPGTHRFVPVSEAVRILGLSATTIRRKIDAGELEAERVVRPQGTAFLVKVPANEPPRTAEPLQTLQGDPTTPHHAPLTNHDAPPGAEYLAAVVVPLVAQIDALRQTVERQADTIADLREDRGRQAAELDAARAQVSTLEARTASQTGDAPRELPTPLSRLLALWRWLVLVLVVAVTTMTVLLVWPG